MASLSFDYAVVASLVNETAVVATENLALYFARRAELAQFGMKNGKSPVDISEIGQGAMWVI